MENDERYKKGDLVLDFFEVVEYIGFEEDEEDCYHRLFSLKTGEYLQSAVVGPTVFKDSDGYEEIVRVWNLNVKRHKENLENKNNILKNFCENFEIHKDYKLWYSVANKINIFDKTELGWFREGHMMVSTLNVNTHDLEKDEYNKIITQYINIIIEKHLKEK